MAVEKYDDDRIAHLHFGIRPMNLSHRQLSQSIDGEINGLMSLQCADLDLFKLL